MLAYAQITIQSDTGIYAGDDPPLGALEIDQLWLDTYETPNILFRWNGCGWVKCGDNVDLEDYYTKTE